ncbi:MAG: reverse transcriptase domain-containing protein, partial [Gaiellaceae bacterium]
QEQMSTTTILPTWIIENQKIMYLHEGRYHKGFLTFQDNRIWRFTSRHRNGSERWGVNIPGLINDFQTIMDKGIVIPGWQNPSTFIIGRARPVLATLCQAPCPRSLRQALDPSHPDRQMWLDSYKEELNGLIDCGTFAKISHEEYQHIRQATGNIAIPSTCVLTIKRDSSGAPQRAKSRIVVLGNQDPVAWSKSDCFAPVVSYPIVRLLAALAVQNKTTLKQADCKNAFCQSNLPDDEVYII